MRRLPLQFAASAAALALAAPAAAQYSYPYPQQTYPQPGYGYPQQTYPQPGYGYPQPGYAQSGIGAIIGQLLGNRYGVTERTAVERCASAALVQAGAQYRQGAYQQGYAYPQPGYAYPQQGYGYGYGQGYNPATAMRVTAITEVQRRQSGLRVSGLLDSGREMPPYGQAYGYRNQGYAATGDLSFRCNVDYRGVVTGLRVRRADAYRG